MCIVPIRFVFKEVTNRLLFVIANIYMKLVRYVQASTKWVDTKTTFKCFSSLLKALQMFQVFKTKYIQWPYLKSMNGRAYCERKAWKSSNVWHFWKIYLKMRVAELPGERNLFFGLTNVSRLRYGHHPNTPDCK